PPHGELRANEMPSTGRPGVQSENQGAGVRIAFLDAFSGISGDMTVGALLHLGLPLERVREAVETLDLRDVEVGAERISRSGIAERQHARWPGPRRRGGSCSAAGPCGSRTARRSS